MIDLSPENVQDYPRPPLIEAVPQRISVVFAGVTIADTVAGWRVCETHHPPTYYIPRVDWRAGALRPLSGAGSFCEWKGRAQYFDVVGGDDIAARAAWGYPAPTAGFAALAACATVYPRPMQACYVGDVAVTPQPGGFYGGWVTPNLTGRIKGAPGTEFW
jgi:uncharacterized protein (DUF427 family)